MPGLGGIIGLITGIPQLLDAGKSLYEAIAGKPSEATTSGDLQTEVANLTPAQGEQWIAEMNAKLNMYKAETDRLVTEEGTLDAATLAAIGPEMAGKVAWLRMTTRPWAVRKCIHLIFLPFYVYMFDKLFSTFNWIGSVGRANKWWDAIYQFPLLADDFRPDSPYSMLLKNAQDCAFWVVVCYFGLRTVDQGMKSASGGSGEGLVGAVGNVVSSVSSLFTGKKTPK